MRVTRIFIGGNNATGVPEMTAIVVKSDDKYVTNKGVTGFDWTARLGHAEKFADEKAAKAALRTLGWNARMKDAVRFLKVSEAG